MFSSRLNWDVPPNALARLLAGKRETGAPILDLTESNPTAAGIAYSGEILAALSDRRSLRYEPSPTGLPEAREAVSAYYARRGHTVSPERILLTASTSEAYAYLFKLLASPGDQILVPRPSYPLFDFLAALESVEVVRYPLIYHDGWSVDFDALGHAVTPRTRAVVVVNPNNPTGSFLKHDDLRRLADVGLPILSDEVFSDYAFGPDPARLATLVDVTSPPVFCLSGLSKVAGLPQMKLGWIVANDAQAFDRLELIADTYLSVATPVQHAAARLLAAGERIRASIAARVRYNLGVLQTCVARRPELTLLRVEGGWYATLQVPSLRSEEEWALELLERYDVLVQPGYFYDFDREAFLVLSLLPPPDAFQAGIDRLGAALRPME